MQQPQSAEEGDDGGPTATATALSVQSTSPSIKTASQQATVVETLRFAFDCGPHVALLFVVGIVAAVLNGLVLPGVAYLLSQSFSDLSGTAVNGIGPIREIAFTFLVLGVFGLVVASIQTWCFEVVAYKATLNFRLQWFEALLRQDTAYFDVHNVSGLAGQVGPSCLKYRCGLGRKFGEGVQFLTTGVGGVVFAFYVCWQVTFVVLGVLPLCGASAMMVMSLNQTKGARAAAAYQQAGSVAYTAVSAIKTVLSLNAAQTMIDKYSAATLEAYQQATAVLVKQGFANGAFLWPSQTALRHKTDTILPVVHFDRQAP